MSTIARVVVVDGNVQYALKALRRALTRDDTWRWIKYNSVDSRFMLPVAG